MNIVQCEFCGRSSYLSDHETCSGCGAPLPIKSRSALMYDPRVFNQQDGAIYEMLARPGMNIPVNLPLPRRGRLQDFIHEAALLGASLCGPVKR